MEMASLADQAFAMDMGLSIRWKDKSSVHLPEKHSRSKALHLTKTSAFCQQRTIASHLQCRPKCVGCLIFTSGRWGGSNKLLDNNPWSVVASANGWSAPCMAVRRFVGILQSNRIRL